jgi:hypothetical protein
LLAFKEVKKLLANYRGYPAYKKAQQIGMVILRRLGGKTALTKQLNNLKGMQVVDYATARHGRRNQKQWMPLRKGILKWVENVYAGYPVSKLAAQEYKLTLELEKEPVIDGSDRYKIDPGSKFDLKSAIPRVDIKDVE